MNDRAAADAPRVDALLDRLGDRLSGDPAAAAKAPAVPRPMLGRVPPPKAARPEPPGAVATDQEPVEDVDEVEDTFVAASARELTGEELPLGPPPPLSPPTGAPPTGAPPTGVPELESADLEPDEPSGEVDPSEAASEAPDGDTGASASPTTEPPPSRGRSLLSSLEDAPAATDSLPPDAPRPEGSGLAEPPFFAAQPADEFAEFESGDLPSESTRIEDRELIADESTNMLRGEDARPTLLIESGKDEGREFVLQDGETSVGRGIDNDIILTDVSVSRKHMRLVCDEEGITLVDLGSGNGTTLNGRRIHRALLGDGDRIEIGETVLVARIPGAKADLYSQATQAAPLETTSDERLPSADVVAPPAPGPWTPPYQPYASIAPPADRTPERGTSVLLGRGTLLAGAALLVVIASMVGAIAMAFLLRDDPPTGGLGTLPVVPPTPPPTALPPLVPGTAPTSTGPTPIATVTPPTPAVAAPPVVAPPVVTPPVVTPPVVTPPVVTPPVVTAPVVPPPAPVVPPPSTATSPGPRTETPRAETPRTETPRTETPRAETPRAEPRTGRTGRTGRDARPATAAPSTIARGAQPDPRILIAYRAQQFAEAVRLARVQADGVTGGPRSQLQQLATNIETFARRWPAARQGRDIAAMEEAIRMDRRVAGPAGAFSSQIEPRLVVAYVTRARSTMGGQPANACSDVRAALALQASNGDARALLRDCETRARRMMQEAQGLERSDPARARTTYDGAARLLPDGHELRRDAMARSAAVGRSATSGPRARPVDEDE